MYSKIQPQQINLHTFSSPSGHVNFSQGANYVYGNLSPTISGDFNIVGNLSINGSDVSVPDSSNFYSSEYNDVIGGTGNNIGGTGNVLVNGDDSTILGNDNVIVNGFNCSIDENSHKNTILGGSFCSFIATTGTTILQDQSSVVVNANKNNALYISFTGGSYVASKVYMQDNLYLGALNSLYLSPSSSGIFSGSISVGGDIYYKGSILTSSSDLTGASGILAASIAATGSTLNSKINTLSGNLTPQVSNSVQKTGAQVISGDKTFADDLFLNSASIISTTGVSANYVQLSENNAVPEGNLFKVVSKNSIAILFDAFAESTQFSNLVNGDSDLDTCFIVGTENEFADASSKQIVVDSFGNTKIAGTLIAEGLNAYQPSSSGDLFGPNGLITKTGNYLYIKQDNTWSKFKASDWVEKTGQLWLDGTNTNISWIDGKIQNNGRIDIFSTGTGGGGGGGFTGNGVEGYININSEVFASWSNGLMTLDQDADWQFLEPNGKNGTLNFVTTTGDSSISWTDGQITSTGTKTINIPEPITLPINSGDYIFPPSGWEEMTMNFTDVDGFLRTRTFLVRST